MNGIKHKIVDISERCTSAMKLLLESSLKKKSFLRDYDWFNATLRIVHVIIRQYPFENA